MRKLNIPGRFPLTGRLLMALLAAALLVSGFASVAAAKGVKTRLVKPDEIQSGTYSLITYGCHGTNDLKSVAILQKEGTPYNFGVNAPRAEYQVTTGLTADEALRRAEEFVTCNPNANQTELTRIMAPSGEVVGYQVTPVYVPLRAGSSDGVDTSFKIKGDTILASVHEDPLLQMDQMGGG